MDDNIRDVLIALVTVAGGLLTALLVTFLTNANTRRVERDRWKRELYADLIGHVTTIRDAIHLSAGGTKPEEGWGRSIDRGQRVLAEIKMLEPKMGEAAGHLWMAVGELILLVRGPVDYEVYGQRDARVADELSAFIVRANRDLG